MAKSSVILIALYVFTIESAVLRDEGSPLKRVARCDICQQRHEPPSSPPFGPPRPPRYYQAHQWTGYAKNGNSEGVFSGAAAATQGGDHSSGQAFSLAASEAASGAGYGGQTHTGSGTGVPSNGNTAGSYDSQNDKLQHNYNNNFRDSEAEKDHDKEHHNNHEKQRNFNENQGFKHDDQYSQGFSKNQDRKHEVQQSQGFENQQQQQIQLNTFNSASQAQSSANSAPEFDRSHSEKFNSAVRGDITDQFENQEQKNAGAFGPELKQGQFQKGFGSNGGNSGFGKGNTGTEGVRSSLHYGRANTFNSAPGAQSSANSGSGFHRMHTEKFNSEVRGANSNQFENQEQESAGAFGRHLEQGQIQKGFRSNGGNSGFGSGNTGSEGVGSGLEYGGQESANSALGGALELASQGLQAPQPMGCSNCGKGSYALSNARSHSGSAIALSIGG